MRVQFIIVAFMAAFIAAFVIVGSSVSVAAQSQPREGTGARPPQVGASPAASPAAQTAAPSDSRTSVDEDFELNIGERHISERNYEASTEVETGGNDARGLNLRVGVMVRAEEIDVLLRNVHGRVRFRASLEPVLRLFNNRRSGVLAPANESSSP